MRRWRKRCKRMGKTVAIDVRSHKVVSEWDVGSSDLQGLALDTERGFLFVACQDHVVSLDIGHDGKVTDSVTTGNGLDDIDFSAEQKVLYAAASVTATLTIAEVSDDGKFHARARPAAGDVRLPLPKCPADGSARAEHSAE